MFVRFGFFLLSVHSVSHDTSGHSIQGISKLQLYTLVLVLLLYILDIVI